MRVRSFSWSEKGEERNLTKKMSFASVFVYNNSSQIGWLVLSAAFFLKCD